MVTVIVKDKHRLLESIYDENDFKLTVTRDQIPNLDPNEDDVYKELFSHMDRRFEAFQLEVTQTKAENEKKFAEFKKEVLFVNNQRFDELKNLIIGKDDCEVK